MSVRARHARGQRAFFERVIGGDPVLRPRPGVLAVVNPVSPDDGFPNSVLYEDQRAAIDALDDLDAAYAAAGIRGRMMWVDPGDEELATALAGRGWELEGVAEVMGAAIDDLRLVPLGDLDLDAHPRWVDVGRIDDLAWGEGPGMETHFAARPPAGGHAFVARVAGMPAACAAVEIAVTDAYVSCVGVVEEHRRRGLAARVVCAALIAARQAGARTTTLDSTAMGRGVYERLGYHAAGPQQRWKHEV